MNQLFVMSSMENLTYPRFKSPLALIYVWQEWKLSCDHVVSIAKAIGWIPLIWFLPLLASPIGPKLIGALVFQNLVPCAAWWLILNLPWPWGSGPNQAIEIRADVHEMTPFTDSFCIHIFLEIRFWPPPPTPEFLGKDFCLQPGLERKFLLQRTWPRQTFCRKNCSYCSFQDLYQVSSARIHFSHPEWDGKSSNVGVGAESESWSSS